MLPLSEIAQQRTTRLIPDANYKPPVLRALVDSDEELEALAEFEGRTSRRRTSGVSVGEYDAWGRNTIQAAFTYRRKGGNRFNDETRSAWYAAFEDRTALHEVAFHRTRELGFTNSFHEEAIYVAIHAGFIGRFHDLRVDPSSPCLDANTDRGYPLGQKMANELIALGSRGLIYPSVRLIGGTCIVAFQPNVVQDVTPGARWKITWSGSPAWQATAA